MLGLLTSTILQSVVEYLHTIGTTLRSSGDTISLSLGKQVGLVVILRLWGIFLILGSLHWLAGQNLMTLFQRVCRGCVGLFIGIQIVNARSSLLRLAIWLTLLGIDLFCEESALWSRIRAIYGSCSRPLSRSLGQVACVRITVILISELRMTCPNLPAMLVPSTNRTILLRLSCHCGISCEGWFLLIGLEVVLDHWKPSICSRLHHIVVFDGSEIKKRLFLNRFTRELGLLHIVAFAWVSLGDCRYLRDFVACNLPHWYRWLFHQQLYNSCNSNPKLIWPTKFWTKL